MTVKKKQKSLRIAQKNLIRRLIYRLFQMYDLRENPWLNRQDLTALATDAFGEMWQKTDWSYEVPQIINFYQIQLFRILQKAIKKSYSQQKFIIYPEAQVDQLHIPQRLDFKMTDLLHDLSVIDQKMIIDLCQNQLSRIEFSRKYRISPRTIARRLNRIFRQLKIFFVH